MFVQYFKQAFHLLKENKLISFITIAGTAFSIAMIMVMVLTIRAKISDFAPETKRERSLIFMYAGLQNLKNVHWQSNGPISYKTAKECFKELKTAETVTIFPFKESMLAAQPAGEKMSCDVQQTDDAYWNVFDFSFIAGAPYDQADFDAGLTKAVLSEEVARKVFGTVDVVGRTILLNHAEYTVCGVVRNVSMLAEKAYAQAWIPLTSTEAMNQTWADGIMGSMQVIILAHSKDDFPAIREEIEKLRQQYVATLTDVDLLYRGQPDTYFVASTRYSANNPPSTKQAIRAYIITIVVLLIVPAINLSGLTLSRMRKRLSEIGLRKAFGASRFELMMQILSENLLYTLLGGILGLILSYLSVYLLTDMLFGNMWTANLGGESSFSTAFLLSPEVFLFAFLFCLVLNLLSASIPAWRTARKNITDSLNER